MALSRKNRITKRVEFRGVIKTGRTARGSFLFIKFKPNNTKFARFGIIVPLRAYKKATQRNRIKRFLSEEIRKNIKTFKMGFDYVILVKKEAKEEDLKTDLSAVLGGIK